MRALIIDDHEVVRRGLAQILRENFEGLDLAQAGDARQALTLLAEHPWDIVLLDINLPGRSGIDLLQEIRLRSPRTRVLVISAYPEGEFALRALKLGAVGYLTKNSAADELVAAFKKALAGGMYVTASLAEKLASGLQKDFHTEPHEALSNRELEVLGLISSGKTLKEIAADLALSEKTVATYRARLSHKLGLSTNVELARYAIQHGLAH
jgi:DNA-binding NarL/FixJ family response regulator